ncbi:MAG TPA: hypothetical protein VFO55_05385, partial [Gemmatimonadaceae bacterium]|nr:hypothetical protein [Gemmatimonadaceae bacterium]
APEVMASSMMIRPDGSFIMAMGYRNTASGRFWVMPFSGTCAQDGDGFVARWEGAGQTKVTLAGDTLKVNNAGMIFAYRRQR